MSYVRSKRYPELFRPDGSKRWSAFLPNPAGGPQLREPTGHLDEQAAHAWYLERVRRPHQAEDKKECRLLDALDARIAWLTAARLNDDPTRKKLAAATIEFYVKKSRQVVRILGGDTALSAIGHRQIRRYITERTKETAKGTTISKELTALSCAMRLARKDGYACPVFADILPDDFSAKYVPKTRWLPEDEVEAFCRVLNPKRVPLFLFLVCTGATYPSEVTRVRRVNVVEHRVHLPGTKTATRDRYVYVPSYGRKFLKRSVLGIGPSGFEAWGNIRRDLHIAAEKLEVAACSPNDLRRTFAQWLVRSGVPYELAAPMMGHGSTRMLEQVYGRRDAAAVADLVEIALRKAPKGARRAG